MKNILLFWQFFSLHAQNHHREEWKEITKWFRENNEKGNYISSRIELKSGKYGRGIFAREPIPIGTKLFSISKRKAFTGTAMQEVTLSD